MRILGLIPARGGSKGIESKNLQRVGGLSLVAAAVRVAIDSMRLARVIVSTDEPGIAEAAREYGAETPFARPCELASDEATTAQVVEHALHALGESGDQPYDAVLVLQPTSPLRSVADVVGAVELWVRERPPAVVSVSAVPHPPEWIHRILPDGTLVPWAQVALPSRRQEAEALYQLNGALYLVDTDVFCRERSLLPAGTRAFIMPKDRSVDIDDDVDMLLAEALFSRRSRDK